MLVAFGNVPESAMIDVLRETDYGSRDVLIVPRLYEVHRHGEGRDHIGAIPVLLASRRPEEQLAWKAKRALDVIVSGLCLLLGAPALAAVALAVRIEGGPGVLFRQERVGREGRHFELLKFRSFKPIDDTESATRWNVSNGARMGRVGRFIRKTSLDEIPQLINILRGDMSLVGLARSAPFSSRDSPTSTLATSTATGSRAGLPDWRRSAASAATRRSLTGPGSTTTTSRTGASGSTPRSF